MDCRLYRQGIVLFVLCVATQSQQTLCAQTAAQWRDSLTVLNKAIASRPWSTDLHLRKAAVNLELQQWQYAIDEYGLVLQREAHNPAALFYRGYASTQLRHYDMARRDYEELLHLFPRHTEARLALAYVLQRMGRKTEALDELNVLVEQRPDSAVAYVARASLEEELKQDEPALYDWEQAIRLEPQNADYVASRVALLLRLKRKDEAKKDLDAALQRGIPRGLLHQWYERCRKMK